MTQQLIVNCINLEHRDLRKQQAERQAKEQGFYIRFWEGIIERHDRKKGICMAHKQIVKDAKECGYPMTVIAEDDLLFFAPFAWDYFLSQIPDDFDLFMSMIYTGSIDSENRITSVFSGMTMYCIHQRFYNFFLELPDSCHIDREVSSYADQFKFLVCNPFVCEQDGSRSDNNFMTCDYRPHLEGRKLYGIN